MPSIHGTRRPVRWKRLHPRCGISASVFSWTSLSASVLRLTWYQWRGSHASTIYTRSSIQEAWIYCIEEFFPAGNVDASLEFQSAVGDTVMAVTVGVDCAPDSTNDEGCVNAYEHMALAEWRRSMRCFLRSATRLNEDCREGAWVLCALSARSKGTHKRDRYFLRYFLEPLGKATHCKEHCQVSCRRWNEAVRGNESAVPR